MEEEIKYSLGCASVTGESMQLLFVDKSCVSCRRHFGRTIQQQMAVIPTDRVTQDQPPFYLNRCGLFWTDPGKTGRSLVKCYGAIFTCLASRAVHIEMAA